MRPRRGAVASRRGGRQSPSLSITSPSSMGRSVPIPYGGACDADRSSDADGTATNGTPVAGTRVRLPAVRVLDGTRRQRWPSDRGAVVLGHELLLQLLRLCPGGGGISPGRLRELPDPLWFQNRYRGMDGRRRRHAGFRRSCADGCAAGQVAVVRPTGGRFRGHRARRWSGLGRLRGESAPGVLTAVVLDLSAVQGRGCAHRIGAAAWPVGGALRAW